MKIDNEGVGEALELVVKGLEERHLGVEKVRWRWGWWESEDEGENEYGCEREKRKRRRK